MIRLHLLAVFMGIFTAVLHAQSPLARPPVPGAPASITAFVDVAVIPMDTERVLPNHTVLVEGGRITALGRTTEVKVPAGALRIDGWGKYLIPGLVDMHVHIGYYGSSHSNNYPPKTIYSAEAERRLFSWLADGVTTIRNLDMAPPNGKNGIELDGASLLRLKARAAAGELLSPRISTSGAWAERYLVEETIALDSVAAYIAAYKAAGYDFLKLHEESQELAEVAAAAARRVGLTVMGHVRGRAKRGMSSSMTPEQAVAWAAAMGYTSIEHVDHLNDLNGLVTAGGKPLTSDTAARLRAVAMATQRAGIWTCPTLAVAGWQVWPQKLQIIKALQHAGAGLLLGTDAPFNRLARSETPRGLGQLTPSVHHELQDLVLLAGLTPYQALVTGTRNPAVYFGTLEENGTVAVGKRADLALLYGNPLVNIRHTNRPAGVMLGGRWLPRAKLDRRLAGDSREERRKYYTLYTRLALAEMDRLFNLLWADTTGRLLLTDSQRSSFRTTRDRDRLLVQQNALVDSLVTIDSLGANTELASAHQRLLQLPARYFGHLRTVLTREQRSVIDLQARAWIQEYAAQGYQITIPGP